MKKLFTKNQGQQPSNNIAKHLLKHSGTKIYILRKQILRLNKFELKEIPEVKTKIFVKERKTQIREAKIVEISYSELRNKGYKIISQNIEATWSPNIRKIYVIVPIADIHTDYDGVPDKHNLELDTSNNRIRIVGPNTSSRGWSEWVIIPKNSDQAKTNKFKFSDPWYAEKRHVTENLFPEFEQGKMFEKLIPQLVCGRTDDNRLLGIPNLPDEPVIGLVGPRGTGKTSALQSIFSRAFWKWNRHCGFINDALGESPYWSKVWETKGKDEKMYRKLKSINEPTIGLPIIALYPNFMNVGKLPYENDTSFRCTVSFKHILENYNNFFEGFKELKFTGPALAALINLKDELIEASKQKNPKEALKLVLDKIEPESTKVAITTRLETILNLEIADIGKVMPATWRVAHADEKLSGNYIPFTACLVAGLFPVLVTRELDDQDYFPSIFDHIVRDIFNKQRNNPKFKDMRIWLGCDEATELMKTHAEKILNILAGRGRMTRIGFTWATQSPEKISDRIYDNTHYLFPFKSKATQAEAIVKQYNLEKHRKRTIMSLKKFHTLACTTSNFVLYDEYGEAYEDNEDHVTEMLPSLNAHKPPVVV